jgi:hypothetical protein
LALPPLSLTSGMVELSVLYDREGRTLTLWFSDRRQEHVCEETGEEVVLMKDAAGRLSALRNSITRFQTLIGFAWLSKRRRRESVH